MYTLITNQYRKFFEYQNSFHFPEQSGIITYLNEETGDTKEVEIETQQTNIEDFTEGNEEESVLIYVPEIPELQYYVLRVKNNIE